eukprot:2189512-Ditylum_brightwellii.AAC.1
METMRNGTSVSLRLMGIKNWKKKYDELATQQVSAMKQAPAVSAAICNKHTKTTKKNTKK